MISIYQITNLVNGKQYIGQSNNIKARWSFHYGNHGDSPVGRAIQKYGVDTFEFKVLQENLSLEEANRIERELIASLNTLTPNGYNVHDGGFYGNPLAGLSDEQMAERNRKISEGNRGQKRSAETRQRMSEAKRGKTTWNKGKKMTFEQRYKNSQSKKGLKRTAAQRNRISAGLTGRKLTEQHRNNMREAQRKRRLRESLRNV